MRKDLFLLMISREKSLPLNKLKELYSFSEEVYGIKIDKRN